MSNELGRDEGNNSQKRDYFVSDDFEGATPPPKPTLEEQAAQMRRERHERYEREAAESAGSAQSAPSPATGPDDGPETQAMDAVVEEPSVAAAPTAPIHEPVDPPFAPTAPIEPDSFGQQPSTSALPTLTATSVPGVTDDAEFVTEPAPSRVFSKILQWVVAILTPLVVLIGAVRTVASGAFMWLEYHRPGFPADAYGFSTADRTTLGSYGLNYINGYAGSSYLGDLRTPAGERTLAEPKLFKATEVQHMSDVQSLIGLAYLVAAIAALIIVISLLVLRVRYAGGVRRGLFAGAWATLGVLLALGVAGVVGWNGFFTNFHKLFFSGNWEFFLDDTLIRLYPPQFWVDAAVVLAALAALVSVILLIITWPTRSRREASRNKQNARVYRLG